MDYETAMNILRGKFDSGIKLGLNNMRLLMEKFDNPQEKLNIIHIAGTNGKGSCTSFLNSVLVAQGYNVGMFTSPSIYNFEERIRINNKNIDENELIELMNKVRDVASTLEVFPSDFELITAIAFIYFERKKCDYVILEVGLGGRLDATNIVNKPILTMITSISYDHQQYLGDTLEEITFEKAGIIKENTPLVVYSQAKKIENLIVSIAKEKKTNYVFNDLNEIIVKENNTEGQIIDYKRFKNLKINLLGSHQLKNATISLEAIEKLIDSGIKISDEAIYKGFSNVIWPCRFEIVGKKPFFVLDGAHNVDGIDKFILNVEEYFSKRKKIAIFGVLADKDYEDMLSKILPTFDVFLTVTPDSDRAMNSNTLKDLIESKIDKEVYSFNDYNSAINKSKELSNFDDVICAFGSLYFVGEVRKLLGVEDY